MDSFIIDNVMENEKKNDASFVRGWKSHPIIKNLHMKQKKITVAKREHVNFEIA